MEKMTRLSFTDVVSTSYSRYSWLVMIACQLIAFLCIGTIIYIVAIVFVPTHNIKFSGFSKNGALCSTISSKLISGCLNSKPPSSLSFINSSEYHILTWSSCGESCPSQPKDGNDTESTEETRDCRQLRVNVRNFGTDISFEGCTNYKIINCDGIGDDSGMCEENDRCIKTGLYRCYPTDMQTYNESDTEDYEIKCTEVSNYFKCALTTKEEMIDCSSGFLSCFKSKPGLYQCNSGTCSKVVEPVNCQRLCKGIETTGRNVFVHQRDKIHSAYCKKAVEKHSGRELWPLKFRNFVNPNTAPSILLNCQDIRIRKHYDKYGNESDWSLIFNDCVNGTVLENASLPDETDLAGLSGIWTKEMVNDDNLLDPINQKYAPRTSNLSLYWNIPLYFIYDPCGNPPSSGACLHFYKKFGIPANSDFPQSTFPCFYANKYADYTYAVVEATRLRTAKEIWQDAVIPTVIAVSSCFIVLVFAVAVTIIVFLHPLINENFSSNITESYDDISHTAGKRPSIIFTVASPATPTKTAVHNFSLSPGKSYIRRSSHPNLSSTTYTGEDGRKRVSWVEPGPVEQRWAY